MKFVEGKKKRFLLRRQEELGGQGEVHWGPSRVSWKAEKAYTPKNKGGFMGKNGPKHGFFAMKKPQGTGARK